MSDITSNPFNLPFNAYAAFDAANLKALMIQRLTQGGVFTDQIYEGSNFNSLLDVIAYSYNVLLFYLNKTASESQYSQAQIYENMNRIVKVLNYNPVGSQTSVLSFNATAPAALSPDAYTIPRFSYITANGITYSFINDATFIKTNSSEEQLTQLADSNLLYQGIFVEYPLYRASGQPFEQFSLAAVSPDNLNEIIDHSSIQVFVQDSNGIFSQWSRSNSLYLEGPNSKSFECRLGESQRYILKFGNGVYGKQLTRDNIVAVYYLKSDGPRGEIGPNVINNNTLFLYSTPQFNNIFNNIKTQQNYITAPEAALLRFTNSSPSTLFSNLENSDSIRNNAANTFKTQYRLITTQDFETYIKTNFNNLLYDVKVVNNWEYLAEHVRYLYNIGLKAPNNDSRVLLNQVTFADSCDFNNIYVYLVPKILKTNNLPVNTNFLSTGLKTLIVDALQNIKMTTSEVIPMDPVYVAMGIGVGPPGFHSGLIRERLLTPELIQESTLNIGRNPSSRISENEIKNRVSTIIKDYFTPANVKLGQQINIDLLNSRLLNIEGVNSVTTSRVINGQQIDITGLSFIAFNPVYSNPSEDIQLIIQNVNLPYFKIPYLYNPDTLINQINVFTPPANGSTPREY